MKLWGYMYGSLDSGYFCQHACVEAWRTVVDGAVGVQYIPIICLEVSALCTACLQALLI
jgi:hypothetical protein